MVSAEVKSASFADDFLGVDRPSTGDVDQRATSR